jgi:hypothetical protein
VAFSQRETLGESLPEVAVLALLSVYAVGVDYDLALGGGVGVVSGEGVYVGTLHSRWVVVSSGLRAPPVIC